MNYGLAGKSVLVTGACGQIGSRLVHALLAEKAYVIAADIKTDSLKEQYDNHPDANLITYIDCDIASKEQVEKAFKTASDKKPIDILMNNAGVSAFEPFMERPEESFDWVMNVNLKGTFFCIREFIKHSSTPDANIVNVGSLYGLVSPDPRIYTDCDRKNSEVYGATKAGVIQMTKYFAIHAADKKIRVNAVSPGGVRNPTTPQGEDFQKNYGFRCPMKRMAEIDEIVKPILFLASNAASYINGHNLVVDGGFTAW